MIDVTNSARLFQDVARDSDIDARALGRAIVEAHGHLQVLLSLFGGEADWPLRADLESHRASLENRHVDVGQRIGEVLKAMGHKGDGSSDPCRTFGESLVEAARIERDASALIELDQTLDTRLARLNVVDDPILISIADLRPTGGTFEDLRADFETYSTVLEQVIAFTEGPSWDRVDPSFRQRVGKASDLDEIRTHLTLLEGEVRLESDPRTDLLVRTIWAQVEQQASSPGNDESFLEIKAEFDDLESRIRTSIHTMAAVKRLEQDISSDARDMARVLDGLTAKVQPLLVPEDYVDTEFASSIDTLEGVDEALLAAHWHGVRDTLRAM
ncbi:MAG: hypothetical protein KDA28_01765, partial [Phycisphaerales bacterium]|nr:hypothetical protein [Phycisphaerales bacterium]